MLRIHVAVMFSNYASCQGMTLMGIISMLNQFISTFKTDANAQPSHIAAAVEKMDMTIERLSTAQVALFKTDYLE